ncbi:MAG: UDP-N-acetylmuramoyl-tripeptide--D-alanyl-D-alanine ligase [Cytophagales bacterium]|nr:UDP-N-acetylmuramoyl-tripeptide--D-alanyl-D-alanine ligase [Bernardetiaceae bacterium]MDW8211572.1 UDP-N-acetylmuramoyl-tripeptide--D-alanyl-D-alanine ligase [Cytophagales bacterium]
MPAYLSTSTLYQYYCRYPTVSTDTRQLPEKCIFFALRGARFDGNQFAGEALAKGAAYAVVDRAEVVTSERFLLVENVLQSLQDLAKYHRRQLKLPIIAITGTNGKTTTKELVAAVLRQRYRVHATQGNLNNHIGVPLTLLQMDPETEIAVVEMGANRIGDVQTLCQIAEPNFGLITNIGQAHLEGFGSVEGVIRAKTELYDYLSHYQGSAFVNLNNPLLADLSKRTPNAIGYGTPESIAFATLVEATPFICYRDKEGNLWNTQLIGAYNFDNILAAIAIGTYFGVEQEKIHRAIIAYQPSNNRSQICRLGSNTIIMDAYNANPSSMRAAIESFSRLPAMNKIAILGDMLELGSYAYEKHCQIAQQALQVGFAKVIFCGNEFYKIHSQYPNGLFFQTKKELSDWLQKNPFHHAYILLKGSRGIGLETIADLLFG